jgi:hypothetical protein
MSNGKAGRDCFTLDISFPAISDINRLGSHAKNAIGHNILNMRQDYIQSLSYLEIICV